MDRINDQEHAERLALLLSDNPDVIRIFSEIINSPPSDELSQRHEGAVGKVEALTGIRIASFTKREILIAAVSSAVVGIPPLISSIADGLTIKSAMLDDRYTPDSWAASPDFARKVLSLGYADPEFHKALEGPKGDIALLTSIKAHRALDFITVRDNVTALQKSLAATSDIDARFALLTRLLIDYNLLGYKSECGEILTKLSEEDINATWLPAVVTTRILDFASSVTLNSLDGNELMCLSSRRIEPLLEIYNRGGYPNDNDFSDYVQGSGVGVFAIAQAFHLKRMQSATPDERGNIREEWVESIVNCVKHAKKKVPDILPAMIEDAIYSLTRIAFNASLNGDIDHAKEIIELSTGLDTRLDEFGAIEVKQAIVKKGLPVNSQWIRLLDAAIHLKRGEVSAARTGLEFLVRNRASTTNLSIEKALNDLTGLAGVAERARKRVPEAPAIEMNRGYIDAISLPLNI